MGRGGVQHTGAMSTGENSSVEERGTKEITAGRLMLLDTAAMYFRAFYGVPDTVRAPDGTPVNAVRGLLDMIGRLVAEFEPDALIACWDDDWRPQWRVDLVPSYKTHRVAEAADPDIEVVPDPLSIQIPIIVEILTALRIPIVGLAGYEADDIIGTLAATAPGPVDVITSDRDLFQVIDDARSVRVISTARGMSNLEIVTDEVLQARYGVSAGQYADFATLRGDASDGLPGVAGVGEKTAATLLSRYGDLDGIIAAVRDPASSISPGVRAKFRAADDYLTRARPVVAVVRDLDLPVVDAAIRTPDLDRVESLRSRWGLGGSLARAMTALDAAGTTTG